MNIKRTVLILFLLATSISLNGQPSRKYITVQVVPDKEDWTYNRGEKVRFDIRVLRNDIPLSDVEIRYELSEDMMPAFRNETIALKKGFAAIDAGTMRKPGFLRCTVWASYDGREYEGMATAGFEPEKIVATQQDPADFDKFWADALVENSRLPLDPVVTLMPDRCTGKVNVYHVSLQNYRHGARLYGILCVPRSGGTHPAAVSFPGAGIAPFTGDMVGAENGIITFQIGIHGIPVDMPSTVYRELERGALHNYPLINLDNRDEYYYKRVYLGCVRAVDFIYTLPEFDGENLCVQGASQGGALSIVTAALDERIKCVVVYFPALCDLTGYLHGRAGGWPHLFRDGKYTDEKVSVTGYYDVVNFARRLSVPGFYTMGYNDVVCPPTSMYSAYNAISAPKELFLVQETGHFSYPEQWVKAWEWMNEKIMRNR